MDWLVNLTITTVTVLARVLRSSTLAAGRLAAYFVRLAAWPIAGFWGTLLFVFSPVTHTVGFVISPLIWLLNSFPRLQPLYIYFGSAAFIGLVAGLFFKLTSASMLTILNLYDDPNDVKTVASAPLAVAKPKFKNSPSPSPSSHPSSRRHLTSFFSRKTGPVDDGYGHGDEDQDQNVSQPPTPNSQFWSEQQELEMLLANLSSPDSDRGSRNAALAALTGGWRDSPNTKRKRRSVGMNGPLGLGGVSSLSSRRFHTILEEEDDSL